MISVMHLKILGKTDWGAGRLSRVFDKGFGSKSCVSKVTHWLFIIYLEWAERIRGILCDEVLVELGIDLFPCLISVKWCGGPWELRKGRIGH